MKTSFPFYKTGLWGLEGLGGSSVWVCGGVCQGPGASAWSLPRPPRKVTRERETVGGTQLCFLFCGVVFPAEGSLESTGYQWHLGSSGIRLRGSNPSSTLACSVALANSPVCLGLLSRDEQGLT